MVDDTRSHQFLFLILFLMRFAGRFAHAIHARMDVYYYISRDVVLDQSCADTSQRGAGSRAFFLIFFLFFNAFGYDLRDTTTMYRNVGILRVRC